MVRETPPHRPLHGNCHFEFPYFFQYSPRVGLTSLIISEGSPQTDLKRIQEMFESGFPNS